MTNLEKCHEDHLGLRKLVSEDIHSKSPMIGNQKKGSSSSIDLVWMNPNYVLIMIRNPVIRNGVWHRTAASSSVTETIFVSSFSIRLFSSRFRPRICSSIPSFQMTWNRIACHRNTEPRIPFWARSFRVGPRSPRVVKRSRNCFFSSVFKAVM